MVELKCIEALVISAYTTFPTIFFFKSFYFIFACLCSSCIPASLALIFGIVIEMFLSFYITGSADVSCHFVLRLELFMSNQKLWPGNQESNLDLGFRRPLFCPLNYCQVKSLSTAVECVVGSTVTINPLIVERSQSLRAKNARSLDDDLLWCRRIDDLWLLNDHGRLLDHNRRLLNDLSFSLDVLEDQCANDSSQCALFAISPGKSRSSDTGCGNQCKCSFHSSIIQSSIY